MLGRKINMSGVVREEGQGSPLKVPRVNQLKLKNQE